MIRQEKLTSAIKELNRNFAAVVNGKVIEFTTVDILDLIHRLQNERSQWESKAKHIEQVYDADREHFIETTNEKKAEIEQLNKYIDHLNKNKILQQNKIERLTEELHAKNDYISEILKVKHDYKSQISSLKSATNDWKQRYESESKRYSELCSASSECVQKKNDRIAELQKQVDELTAEHKRYEELFGMVGKEFYTVEKGEWEKVKKGVIDMIQQAVKNTAKEILQMFDKDDGTTFVKKLQRIKERYGVEVE